jgi:PSP1 C-terminal conserved region
MATANPSELYLIVFKASRADIFFIADRNFGPEPQIGDMVIVEGDRGSDLGVVEFCKLTPPEAQQRKAEYNQKHYRQLVMFSRMFPHLAAQANQDAVFTEPAANLASSNLASPRGRRDGGEHRGFKVIKRIANESEIKLLRDKEGNEAKAKRIAQAKVNQHGINMEILDAEFQL